MAELPEGTQVVYANWVRTKATPWDLGLDLGYQDEEGPPDSYPVRVVLSWEHAKALSELLVRSVKAYEDQAGPLRSFTEVEGDPPDDD